MMNREDKVAIVDGLKADIDKSQAVFLTNLIGIKSNDAVKIRKGIREAGGKIVVTRNTFFRRASEGTQVEKLLGDLKGTNAVAFAFKDPAAIAKCLNDAGKENEAVELKGGWLSGSNLSPAQLKQLATLPSRDQMLSTLLATFNAPISAFARVLNAIKEKKEISA
ncbi:MAG: 50S ribosomal protein L10 [Bdellovibrionales bacterium RIFOXYB1_FULL_37_110]|nr:MAG: 50S ribosomal protein L10 [Bdellovibrionales bacterium RIFOXYA1_FULL_38_20]OFZ58082.1 MAG: 50S ribosomal protein L10 [Bdellovibrionales bacterium RIFOXYB1_FULL_37_110]OFZ63367.1 MAG: 50S ribosomal protein L10 [Bdellovibrionales bacterium RIFOXYD1_FULL_36_51]